MQYLIILLDDAATSYCSYEGSTTARPIPVEVLRAGIRYAMCENLMIQFIYPPFDISDVLKSEIETIDHNKFMPAVKFDDEADLIVFSSVDEFNSSALDNKMIYALRTDCDSLFTNAASIGARLKDVKRLNIILTNVEQWGDNDFDKYQQALNAFAAVIADECKSIRMPQLNLLTDRLSLQAMNNCGAGTQNITLAPNGKFYVCPAFYYDKTCGSVGDLTDGLAIPNPQLYRLEYAPLCRKCDAFQCRRCVYLNQKTTLEVNTPSHEQCVAAHLERNASRLLLENLRSQGVQVKNVEIKEIDYLDPFDIKDVKL